MDNRARDTVFNNDYIMTHILRMLDLREQYELQKICKRLRFLMTTCVWRRDCKEMQMNQNEMGRFTDDEYFELLQLNANNLQKLTIDADDGAVIQKYFPLAFPNLLEVHIKRFILDDTTLLTIATNCTRLQLLYFKNVRNDSDCVPTAVSLSILSTLKELKALILINISTYVEDLYLLATKVSLERLELDHVRICGLSDFASKCPLDLPQMSILKLELDDDSECDGYCFAKKCYNVKELTLSAPHKEDAEFFDKFKQLESVKMLCSQLEMWSVIRNIKLNHLELFSDSEEVTFQITDIPDGLCSSLQILKVGGESHVWSVIFRSPLSNFENLQELQFINQKGDELMRSISVKCHQLKVLQLSFCEVSGKYLNNFPNLETLTVELNFTLMPWSNVYAILRDCKLLKNLKLDIQFVRDNFTVPPNVQNLANSLQMLIIHGQDCGQEEEDEAADTFLEHILVNCEDSFQNLQTLHCTYPREYYKISSFAKLINLHTLQLDSMLNLDDRDKQCTLKHLVYRECKNLQWCNIVDILTNTNIEIFEILQLKDDEFIEGDYSAVNNDNMWQHIRRITIPYIIFEKTVQFWQLCPKLQLCCLNHGAHTDVLDRLLFNVPEKRMITAIYANGDLSSIKTYCAKNLSSSRIPVHLLDDKNESLWNDGFIYIDNIIVIEWEK